MNKYKRYIPIVAAILAALGVSLNQYGIDLNQLAGGIGQSSQSSSSSPGSNSTSSNQQSGGHSQSNGAKWSKNDPNINLWHIFDGEINKRGKPTGFHSRPNGQDPANARIASIKDNPNRAGVYTANIEINDGGTWRGKFSSFFPDNLSRDEVLDVIVHAYKNRKSGNKQPWSGPSGLGFTVQGYTSNSGGINTAFPVFVRSQ
ncbi:MAG: EndoU domain-containing protein [Granulosicoccaceae bacterium]